VSALQRLCLGNRTIAVCVDVGHCEIVSALQQMFWAVRPLLCMGIGPLERSLATLLDNGTIAVCLDVGHCGCSSVVLFDKRTIAVYGHRTVRALYGVLCWHRCKRTHMPRCN
jgi:hypothetical protein